MRVHQVSAANRTRKGATSAKRRPADDYPTPAHVTRAILPHLATPRTVLEPAAGDGGMMRVVETHWPRVTVHGLEIDSARAKIARVGCYDALDPQLSWRRIALGGVVGKPYDLIITNPPFSLAIEFVKKALASGALECAFLLRLAFLESKSRAAFHRECPSDIYVLPERPSFAWFYSCPTKHVAHLSAGCGHSWSEVPGVVCAACPACGRPDPNVTKCDMAAYAWFVWKRGSKGGHWQILDMGEK